MKLRQYRPAFFSGFQNHEAEFSTIDEMIKIPFVNNFMTEVGPNRKFYRFSMSEIGDQIALMAEYNGGKEWWVVGFFEGGRPNLPIWGM